LNKFLEVKVWILFTGERRVVHHADSCQLDLEQPSGVLKFCDR
jgi:hypothetical protein